MTRQSKGLIYKRKGVKGYCLLYYVNGKRMRVTLRDEDGKNITSKPKAEARAALILSPLTAKTAADRARATAEAAEMAEITAARVSQKVQAVEEVERMRRAKARTIPKKAWFIYAGSRKKAKCCQGVPLDEVPKNGSNYYNYYNYITVFSRWYVATYGEGSLLADVTREIAQNFADDVLKDKSAGTVKKYLRFLKHFFSVLFHECGLDIPNPFEGIEEDGAAIGGKRRKTLTLEEVGRLFDSAKGELRLLCMLGFYTGLRLGDCCCLKWESVDLGRMMLSVIPRKTEKSSGAAVVVGLAGRLLEELRAVPEEERTGYVLKDFSGKYLARRNNVTRPITRLFQECGLKNENGYIEYGFHSFRHTFVSLQTEGGTPLGVIQALVGHSNPVMTEHYTHVSENAAIGAAGVMDSAFRRAREDSGMEELRARALEIVKNADEDILRQVIKIGGSHGDFSWGAECVKHSAYYAT